jgi:mannose-1-phosphate guanylyltransferase/phosphomannomutase
VQAEKWQRELFSEARISGISNIEIHPEFCAKLGAAFGMSIGANTYILSSRAPDNCSRIMKRAFTAGLASVGVSVEDMHVASIPQTRQELLTGRCDAGIHIRRSPRHPNMHDIILFSKNGKDISTNLAKKIERYFFGEDIVRVTEEQMGVVRPNIRSADSYVLHFTDKLEVDKIRQHKFKILVDYSYGLAATILPNILGHLNVEVIAMHDFVDSRRFVPARQELSIGENTNSTSDEIPTIMKHLNYEIGFQIETGAEKICIIDHRGKWLQHHRLLAIMTKLFLETHRNREPYKIAISILAGSEVDEIAKDYNVEVVRIKNAHSAMMEATNDEQVLFVGGSYGGFIFRDFLFAADAMFSVGQILEMLTLTGWHISDLDEQLPLRHQVVKQVDVAWEKKGTVMRKAMEHSEGMERMLVEGVKIFKDGNSVLIYPEKENAKFAIISDSEDPETAGLLAKKYTKLVSEWKDEE